MIYTSREYLSIIEISEERDALSFDEIKQILLERPSNMIYIDRNGVLYGLISGGRISRSSKTGFEIKINRNFVFLHPGEYIQARDIFHERKLGEKVINALPIVDAEGRLLGDYTTYDDMIVMEYTELLSGSLKKSAEGYRIGLIKPADVFKKKNELFKKWIMALESVGIPFSILNYSQILECSGVVDKFLFIDENELTGMVSLHKNILTNMIWPKFITCRDFFACNQDLDLKEDMKLLRQSGIYIYAFDFLENEGGYLSALKKNVLTKYSDHGAGEYQDVSDIPLKIKYSKGIIPEKFFEGIYSSVYESQEFPIPLAVYSQSGTLHLCDMNGALIHIHNNERLTVGQPTEYTRTIYIFGCCFIWGALVEDKHTIPSLLQERLNQEGISCRVVNCGLPLLKWPLYLQHIMDRLWQSSLRQGDIVIFDNLGNPEKIDWIPIINLTDAYETSGVGAEWVVDHPRHANYKAHQVVAEALYNRITDALYQPTEGKAILERSASLIKRTYLDKYFFGFNAEDYGIVGSIVMNCNPFTFGHRHLIEEALKKVDFLIIFVVEEDKSFFSFDERYAMVCAGIVDLENVMVVPSGKFILSQMTFPQYFVKMVDSDLLQSTENDIRIFAEEIAPSLKITCRFIGEELDDAVTAQYNRTMKCILPTYGIEVIEIPRKKVGNKVISASKVREILRTDSLECLDELVPGSTKEILFYRNI